MKISLTFILLALLSSSALSAFVAKQSVTVSGVTYSVGNNGNDCGVTRTESGATISYYYLSGAASGDCVGKNILAAGSNIVVVLNSNGNQDIYTPINSASGSLSTFSIIPIVTSGIIIAQIDTSSTSGTFGKFTEGVTDVGYDFGTSNPEPITYVSAVACDDEKTIQLTVNVLSSYGLVDVPVTFVHVSGNGVKQVYSADDNSLTAYTAAGAPFCTTETTTEESSGIATWKLALIIALPCVALLIGATLFLYFKTAAKNKAAAKTEKFAQLPTSPTTVPGAENQV